MEQRNSTIYFYLLIAIAASLRIYALGSYGITADELSALERTNFNSFSEMIVGGVLVDFHPPLVQTFMYYWGMLFGTTEFVTRLPFALLAIFSIIIYYKIAQKWFNKNVALLAATGIACNQLLLIYSRLARPYAFGLFFTAAATLYLTKIIVDKKADFITIFLFTISGWCAMNTHYFAFLFIATLALCSLIFMNKQNAKPIVIAGIAMLLLYIPSFFILKHQINAGGIGAESDGWLWLPDFNFLIDYFKYLCNGSRYVLLFYGLLLSFIYVTKLKSKTKNSFSNDVSTEKQSNNYSKWRIVALILWIFPIVFGYVYSYTKSPILQHSVLCFGTPFLFIFLFSFVPIKSSKKIISVSFVSMLLVINTTTIIANNFYKTNFFGVYKPIAKRALEWQIKYGAKNITNIINTDNPFFINYYFKQWNRNVEYKGYNFVGRDALKSVAEIVAKSNTEYFSFAWSNIGSMPEITEIIKDKYPFLVERKYFFNSEYYLFSKHKNSDTINEIEYQNFTNFDNGINLFKGNEQCYNTTEGINKSMCVELNSNNEFGPLLEVNAIDLFKNKNNILNVKLKVKKLNLDANAAVVAVFNDNDTTTSWQAMDTHYFTTDTSNWHTLHYSFRIPYNSKISNRLSIYFWNTSKKRILFDDVLIYTTTGNPIMYSINSDF